MLPALGGGGGGLRRVAGNKTGGAGGRSWGHTSQLGIEWRVATRAVGEAQDGLGIVVPRVRQREVNGNENHLPPTMFIAGISMTCFQEA